MRRRPAPAVWVCEPQSVSTDLMYSGDVGSEMSKIFMPSHEAGLFTGWVVLAQVSSMREESVDRNTRSPRTLMSFCEPGQLTWARVFGADGLGDVVDGEAVVVADVRPVALEGEVGAEGPGEGEAAGQRRVAHVLDVRAVADLVRCQVGAGDVQAATCRCGADTSERHHQGSRGCNREESHAFHVHLDLLGRVVPGVAGATSARGVGQVTLPKPNVLLGIGNAKTSHRFGRVRYRRAGVRPQRTAAGWRGLQ